MAKYIQPLFDVYGFASFDSSVSLNKGGDGTLMIGTALTASSASTPYALVLESTTGSVRTRALGTMAWATESDYYTTTESDTNFVDIDGDTMTGVLVFDNLGFTLDGVTIATIETQAEGLTTSDTAMATSNAIRDYVDQQSGAANRGAGNGLKILTDGSYGIGSALTEPTTITTDVTNTLTLAGLQTGTNRLAVISNGGVLQTQQLGTMALANTTSYETKTNLDSSFGLYYTQLQLSSTGYSSVHWGNITNTPTTLSNYGISDTSANFDAALSDANFAYAGGAFHDGFSDFVGNEHIDHSTVTLSGGAGMVASIGDITTSRSIAMGTPSTLTSSTTNEATGTTHTHTITGFTTDGELTTALADYVPAAGGTFTGGVAFGEVGTPVDVSIYSNLYVHGATVIGGDLTIDGSLLIRSVEAIDVSSAFIVLNTGQTGTPPASMQSGVVIDRGDELPYVFLYDESNETFRIGTAPLTAGPSFDDASTQSVATRQDTPTDTGIAFWNSTETRFDTDSDFLWTGSELYLNGDIQFQLNSGLAAITGATQVGGTGYGLTIDGAPGDTDQDGGILNLLGGDGDGTGNGGNIYLRAGAGTIAGDVYIGDATTTAIHLGTTTSIATGTPDANEVLFIDTNDSNKLKRYTVPDTTPSVDWENGNVGSDNEIVTAYGDGSIAAESGLTWNGTSLGVGGNISLTGAARTIAPTPSGATGFNLDIQAGYGSTTAGHLMLYGGGNGANTTGGNAYLRGGDGVTDGNVFIGDSTTTTVYVGAGDVRLPALPGYGAEDTVVVITGSNALGTRELGSMASETATDYVLRTLFDTSIGAIQNQLNVHDTSIGLLETSVDGKIDAVASTTGAAGHEVYSGEASNVAYIKRLTAGAGATISSDSSTIEISVTGSSGYVKKETGSFTASGTSEVLDVSGSFSGGPYTVSVYEGTELIHTGVSYSGSNITLTWAPGSVSGTINWIVSG